MLVIVVIVVVDIDIVDVLCAAVVVVIVHVADVLVNSTRELRCVFQYVLLGDVIVLVGGRSDRGDGGTSRMSGVDGARRGGDGGSSGMDGAHGVGCGQHGVGVIHFLRNDDGLCGAHEHTLGDVVSDSGFFLQVGLDWVQESLPGVDELGVVDLDVPVKEHQQLSFHQVDVFSSEEAVGVLGPMLVLWRRVVEVFGGDDETCEEDSVSGARQALGVLR